MRVLVVEDEQDLAVTVARVLRRFGIAVDVAFDGREALVKAAVTPYDVVVLDRFLPLVSGDEVCSKLNTSAPETKVLMLTARDGLRDRIAGLDLGADDYVSKPFAMRELVARVQALARRRGRAQAPVLRWKELELDPARRQVTRAGRMIFTTAKELAVLEELMVAGGATVSADRLLNAVWDDSDGEPFLNTVRVTVMRLRRKLGDPVSIETVIGSGYRLR
jgi:DNA-binding response OmpR family regulator